MATTTSAQDVARIDGLADHLLAEHPPASTPPTAFWAAQYDVGLRTCEVTAQYLVVHEFIKRLHSRYRKEGIDIPAQVQTIIFPSPVEPAGR